MAAHAKVHARAWKMPEWMEPFRDSIVNTGGNTIEDLMNDRSNVVINAPLAYPIVRRPVTGGAAERAASPRKNIGTKMNLSCNAAKPVPQPLLRSAHLQGVRLDQHPSHQIVVVRCGNADGSRTSEIDVQQNRVSEKLLCYSSPVGAEPARCWFQIPKRKPEGADMNRSRYWEALAYVIANPAANWQNYGHQKRWWTDLDGLVWC